jgi:hypothetical protein
MPCLKDRHLSSSSAHNPFVQFSFYTKSSFAMLRDLITSSDSASDSHLRSPAFILH